MYGLISPQVWIPQRGTCYQFTGVYGFPLRCGVVLPDNFFFFLDWSAILAADWFSLLPCGGCPLFPKPKNLLMTGWIPKIIKICLFSLDARQTSRYHMGGSRKPNR